MDAKCTNIKDLYYEIILIFRRTKLPKDDLIRHIMEFVMYDELDNQTIRQAVRDYHRLIDIEKSRFKFGPLIRCWNTSKVTSLMHLFQNIDNFHGDLSGWDVSNVETMHGMLYNAHNFNGNLTGWKIPKVVCTHNMFVNSNCEMIIISMIEELSYKISQRENGIYCNCAKYNLSNVPSYGQTIIIVPNIQHLTLESNSTNIIIPNIQHLTFESNSTNIIVPNIRHLAFGNSLNQSNIPITA